jgi:hypothetical protein
MTGIGACGKWELLVQWTHFHIIYIYIYVGGKKEEGEKLILDFLLTREKRK